MNLSSNNNLQLKFNKMRLNKPMQALPKITIKSKFLTLFKIKMHY